jgi:hypothetical protein
MVSSLKCRKIPSPRVWAHGTQEIDTLRSLSVDSTASIAEALAATRPDYVEKVAKSIMDKFTMASSLAQIE